MGTKPSEKSVLGLGPAPGPTPRRLVPTPHRASCLEGPGAAVIPPARPSTSAIPAHMLWARRGPPSVRLACGRGRRGCERCSPRGWRARDRPQIRPTGATVPVRDNTASDVEHANEDVREISPPSDGSHNVHRPRVVGAYPRDADDAPMAWRIGVSPQSDTFEGRVEVCCQVRRDETLVPTAYTGGAICHPAPARRPRLPGTTWHPPP